MTSAQTIVIPPVSLKRYLSILINEYPHSIKASQLSHLAGVTKASVTKVRQRLLSLCNTKEAASKRSFVLKSDVETFFKIFMVFALTGSHREFFISKYVRLTLLSERTHDALSSNIPNYGDYFDMHDTHFILERILDFMMELDPPLVVKFLKSLITDSQHAIPIQVITEMESMLPFVLNAKSEAEFMELMKLRDKFFFLIRGLLWAEIEQLGIIKSKDYSERAKYAYVYKDTVDYYLRSFSVQIDTALLKIVNKDRRYSRKMPRIGTVILEQEYGGKSH